MRFTTEEAMDYRDKLVVEARALGKTQAQIGAEYGFNQSTISRILKLYRSNGNRLPLPRWKNTGKKPLLEPSDEEELKSFMAQGAKAWGYDTDCWDRQRVKELIELKFKVSYHITHISVVLRRINYTLQKPKRRDYRQDAEQKEKWKKETLPALKKRRQKMD